MRRDVGEHPRRRFLHRDVQEADSATRVQPRLDGIPLGMHGGLMYPFATKAGPLVDEVPAFVVVECATVAYFGPVPSIGVTVQEGGLRLPGEQVVGSGVLAHRVVSPP